MSLAAWLVVGAAWLVVGSLAGHAILWIACRRLLASCDETCERSRTLRDETAKNMVTVGSVLDSVAKRTHYLDQFEAALDERERILTERFGSSWGPE